MNRVPLAERMRPQKLADVLGQEEIVGEGKILTEIVKKGEPVNLIFWGPPGTGKTTLARILASEFKAELTESLKNIFYNDGKSNNKFQPINSMYFEWDVIHF